MFYSERMDNVLRFGDVVKGYVSTCPTIKNPVLSLNQVNMAYNINVEIPLFSVVMTPCCSIEEHMVCLTPLIQLRPTFVKNSNFIEDFTIINREIEVEKCFAPDDWEKMEPEKKEEILAHRRPYTLLNLFIYEKHDIFPEYPLRQHTINYYMIDFRNISTIKCEMIKRPKQTGAEDSPIVESKLLQLSDTVREELSNKMAYYYARPREEDEVSLSIL